MNRDGCQLVMLDELSEGDVKLTGLSVSKRLRLLVHRRLNPNQKRTIKKHAIWLLNLFGRSVNRQAVPAPAVNQAAAGLKPGDRVKVRSEDEIRATLNAFGELKGCGFMKEMVPYCGTVQTVLKPVNRFLDERDYQVKKTRGVVLLEGVMCQGTEFFGPCDRSCFFFWREEWLERID